ncbi:MAG: hypothetical protein A2W90_01200 [Bacteroidetes bacterium GWF2_42_66]|nr:MAG: hypothetical protein A2W92_00620 [Bacteroidetes bacterium GWA2_42_15]OFY00996.1 MAG: hypothetical protein A2W89_14690 [Bacteroidetes bacterium GWE2_42_39]OFY41836.1 MAG: hypothetical protein A2W90_01200 [Bacteroidetes bacterium GWF2_42_66]HBL77992.1 hypothetical protein [Prolixibacteraceae bacterium]HCR90245.1 hypothetical protein [Prolixibacteraceae bacterium]
MLVFIFWWFLKYLQQQPEDSELLPTCNKPQLHRTFVLPRRQKFLMLNVTKRQQTKKSVIPVTLNSFQGLMIKAMRSRNKFGMT